MIRPIQKYRRSLTKAINGKIYPLLIIILVLSIFFSIIWIDTDKKEESLKEHYKIQLCKIDSVVIYKGVYYLMYSFKINNRTVKNMEPLNVGNTNLMYLKRVFKNHYMTSIYDSMNIYNSKLLLSQRSYSEFHLTPDSATIAIFKEIDNLRIGKDALK